jgi:hypothetical protein
MGIQTSRRNAESEGSMNEPAFPAMHYDLADNEHGLTMRDYFAAQALTGAQIWDAVLNGREASQFCGGVNKLAEVAYAVADAMLKERSRETA